MLNSDVSVQKVPFEIDGLIIHSLDITISNRNNIKQIVSIPSQIGCSNSCSFCISKDQKLIRNLTQKEISEIIKSIPLYGNETELSFTGEGEPLHNLKNINNILIDHKFDSVKIAFSGLGSKLISQIFIDKPTTLQFSLHQANQQKRNKIIPKSDSLETIKSNLLKYQHKFKKININYVLMEGINDFDEDIKSLEKFTEGTDWTILFNPLLQENSLVSTQPKNINQPVKVYKKIAQSISQNNIYPHLTYQNIAQLK